MRPAQIRVFDGLRLTTDHVNHLQGALSSGFEDLREILGLGRPQSGLGVSIAADGTATIQTGTAFDQQKNRVACDAPLTVKVTFADKETCKFVCLKYEQVEGTAVEGHPTMIWDSCSALVRDQWPTPADNLVVVARIVKEADGTLHVHCPHERLEIHSGDAVMPPAAPPPDAAGSQDTLPVIPPPAIPAPSSDNSVTEQATPPVPDVASGSGPAAAPAQPAPVAAPGALQFRQDVLHLVSDSDTATFLRLVVAPALRQQAVSGSADLSFVLVQSEIAPGISAAALSTQVVLSGSLTFPPPAPADPAAAPAPSTIFGFECVATGEATSVSGGMVQFSSGFVHTQVTPPAASGTLTTSMFTVRGLAEFAFSRLSGAPLGSDLLAGMALVAQVAPSAQGFVFTLKVLWSGTVSDASLKVLETGDIPFAWQVFLGWKAVGN
jgi:hypothetical protein